MSRRITATIRATTKSMMFFKKDRLPPVLTGI